MLIAAVFALETLAQNIDRPLRPVDEDQIFTDDIDAAPEFTGGMDKFYARIQHIPYTFFDRMYNCQGRVVVLMLIEKDGSVSNLKVLHGFSDKQDAEILRVVKRLHKWKPGMRNGKPVRVLCSVPINFKLKESS